jgi:hypothetical protein
MDQVEHASLLHLVDHNIVQVTNADEIVEQIQSKLRVFLETPKISVEPLIYHLDVQAMYSLHPNNL